MIKPYIEIGVGFHQFLTVVGFDAGIEHGQCTLTEQAIQTTLALVLEPVYLVVGKDLEAALGGDQGIHGGFSHRW